jgi:hypothetical protein
MRNQLLTTVTFLALALPGLTRAVEPNCTDIDPGAKAAAWYVTSKEDVTSLKKKCFNLFFLNRADNANITSAVRDNWIEEILAEGSDSDRFVLPIDNFLVLSWYHPDGMQEFVRKWGNHHKIYGFLLKDDVLTSAFPSETQVRNDALWVYRWHYRMIRNAGNDTRNGYNTDLAPGKKIIVTLGFDINSQNSKFNHCGLNGAATPCRFGMNPKYVNDVPPNFLVPGEAWDIVMAYWYPRRIGITRVNEDYIMDTLYAQMRNLFPQPGAMIPIIQTAEEGPRIASEEPYPLREASGPECGASAPSSCVEPEPYNLGLQYLKFVQHGLINSSNRVVAYYSANGHWQVYNNLLHWNAMPNATDTNIYYREAGVMNDYHLHSF